MDTKLRCGVIGVGYLGQHHARIYSGLSGVELTAIMDSNAERAQAIAAQFGGRIVCDLEEMVSLCDAVSVVVPTDQHCAVALPLLRGGCNLLIEKPLCLSLDEAERILEAANNTGAIVQVGHIEHFNPVMEYLEKAVQEPRYITSDRLAPFNIRGTEVGVVLDLMIHDIGIILQLVRSPVVRIESIGVNVLSLTEDIANARIAFENGCIANINASRVSQKKVREIRVFQPNSYLSLDFMNQAGHLLRKSGMDLIREEIPIEKGEPLMLELAAFTDAVRKRTDPKVGVHLGRTALDIAIQVTERIRGNASEGARA